MAVRNSSARKVEVPEAKKPPRSTQDDEFMADHTRFAELRREGFKAMRKARSKRTRA